MSSRVVIVGTGKMGPSGIATASIDDLTDVAITAAASGDILRHNGTAWVDSPGPTHFEVAGAVATHTGDSTDAHPASAIGITDAGGNFSATNVEAALAEIADEYMPLPAAPSIGDVATWSGTEWVADPITLSLFSADTITPAADDYVAMTDTSTGNANAKGLVTLLVGAGINKVWIPATSFALVSGGATASVAASLLPVWNLQDAGTPIVGTTVMLPVGWSSFTVVEWLVGLTATTGDVVLDRRVYTDWSDGDTLSTGAGTSGAGLRTVLSTAAKAVDAINVVMADQVGTAVTADNAQMVSIYYRRNGTDGADTYAGNVGLIGIQLVRAS